MVRDSPAGAWAQHHYATLIAEEIRAAQMSTYEGMVRAYMYVKGVPSLKVGYQCEASQSSSHYLFQYSSPSCQVHSEF